MTQVHVLAQARGAATELTGAGSDDETVLATVTIKGGTMHKDGRLNVKAFFTVTNSANDKLIKVRFGGLTGDVLYASTNTTVAMVDFDLEIANRGAVNSQVGWVSGVAATTADIDTADDQTLVITGELETTTESIVLEDYVVTMTEPTP